MEHLINAALIGLAIAGLVTVVCISLLGPLAGSLGLVDRPGGRKRHRRPTPLVGGLAMLAGSAAALPLVMPAAAPGADANALALLCLPFGAAMLLVMVAGVIDDRRGLSSGPKFVIQGVAALIAVFGAGLELQTLGTWPGGPPMALGILTLPVTLLAVVGFMNAFNMIDGVDGLAGSTAVVMLTGLALAGGLADQAPSMLIATMLVGACLGFLLFNLRTPWRARARVFLGDAGSLMLGLAIVWLAIRVSQSDSALISPMGIAWIMALPVIDTLNLMVRRLMRGQSPFHADRNHLHHILQRAGFTPGQTAMIFSGLTLGLGIIGIAGSLIGVPDVLLGLLLVLVALGHYFFVRYGWRTARAVRRLRARRDRHRPGAHDAPEIDRLALIGLYTLVVAIPLGAGGLAMLALALVGLASLGQWRALYRDLRGLALTRVALLAVIWLILVLLARPELMMTAGGSMIWLTGVLALPVGWWLARLRHHALALFVVAVAALVVVWAVTADWQRLAAGEFRTPGVWGNTQTSGLLLVLMLMVLIGLAVYGIAHYRRRWRARASLASALVGLLMLSALLVGLQFQTAMAAGLAGVIAMLIAGGMLAERRRVGAGVVASALVAVTLTGVMAVTYAPTERTLEDRYLAPLQASWQYLSGHRAGINPDEAGVVGLLDDWAATAAAVREQPLIGPGRLNTAGSAADGWLPSHRASYAALLLVAGLPAGILAAGLVAAWVRAVAGVARRGVWPSVEGMIAMGLMASVLVFLLLAPVIENPLNGAVMTLVFAIGVVASLDQVRARG